MSEFISSSKKVGILGGGQLGKMLIQAASCWDVQIHVLDPNPACSCAPYAHGFSCGKFTDYQTVLDFGKNLDLLTIEIENVNTEALKKLRDEGKKVYPAPEVIEIIKDKGKQKKFYREHGLKTSDFRLMSGPNEIRQEIENGKLVYPFVQKLCREGYDGRGVSVIRSEKNLENLLDGESIIEPLVAIEKEISVLLSRNEHGEVNVFPPVEMIFDPEANLVDMLLAPARIGEEHAEKAKALGRGVAEALQHVGLIAVEMFLTKEGEILINESAPRPHNSGHQTIEANISSQYEQHMRAILNLPLGSVSQRSKAVMINVLGEKGHVGQVVYRNIEEVFEMEGAYIHLYGKKDTKPFRKMGHITLIGNDFDDLIQNGNQLKKTLKVEAK